MDANETLLLFVLAVVSFVLAFYGAAVGLLLGHLRLPLLGCLYPNATAAAANLAISGLAALSGTAGHAHGGRISWSALVLLGIPSVLGGMIGAWLLLSIDPFWAKLLVGGLLIYSASNLLAAEKEKDKPEPGRGPALFSETAIGLGIGFLSSVTGLMMGSLRLPMMIRYLGIDPRMAVGTNMAVGSLTALSSSALLMWQGGQAPLGTVALLAVPTLAGGWLGAKWTGRIDKATLAKMIGWTVAVAGALMLGESMLKAFLTVRPSA